MKRKENQGMSGKNLRKHGGAAVSGGPVGPARVLSCALPFILTSMFDSAGIRAIESSQGEEQQALGSISFL